MAIQSHTVNGSFTEIYVGGGNFITQAEPTNFHKFYIRKILTPTENISDWREVTEAEKTALEKSDTAWMAPDPLFIKRWNAICRPKSQGEDPHGGYNEATGFFWYGPVKDLTEEDAVLAYDYRISTGVDYALPRLAGTNVRVSIPTGSFQFRSIDTFDCYYAARSLEYVQLSSNIINSKTTFANAAFLFALCSALREIKSTLCIPTPKSTTFSGCKRLESLWLQGITASVTFKDSAPLSLDSIAYMVQYATNTSPITITLHPAAYARVTDEIFTAAAQKQITIASA